LALVGVLHQQAHGSCADMRHMRISNFELLIQLITKFQSASLLRVLLNLTIFYIDNQRVVDSSAAYLPFAKSIGTAQVNSPTKD
jgi:hypothetical protein